MFVLCIGIYIRIASYYVINYDVINTRIYQALEMYLNASKSSSWIKFKSGESRTDRSGPERTV